MHAISSEERRALIEQPLDEKLIYSEGIIAQALRKATRPVVLYTGGKDSTVMLWLVRRVSPAPEKIPALLIDHGLHFPETWEFLEDVKERWNVKLIVARNEDVLAHAQEPGAEIRVSSLDGDNQSEVRRVLGYHDETFPYTLDTEVGNHLLKTVALKRAIKTHGFDVIFVGIRWDEHPARSGEKFFSPREDPPHTRVHPILHLSERDIWTVMLDEKLPTHPLYAKGYRSLDSIEAKRGSDLPAWEQELGKDERSGREQDKEGVMERLRALGYM